MNCIGKSFQSAYLSDDSKNIIKLSSNQLSTQGVVMCSNQCHVVFWKDFLFQQWLLSTWSSAPKNTEIESILIWWKTQKHLIKCTNCTWTPYVIKNCDNWYLCMFFSIFPTFNNKLWWFACFQWKFAYLSIFINVHDNRIHCIGRKVVRSAQRAKNVQEVFSQDAQLLRV